MMRPARSDDRDAVEAIVRAAYSIYIERIGKPPGPRLDDYAQRIAAGAVSVLEEADGTIAAIIVLLHKPDYLLLDNIAVSPDRQGRGFGQQLIAFAEAEARRRGFAELRLYTHEKMTENIWLYRRLGFTEIGRGHEAGYDRVVMRKSMIFHNIYYATNSFRRTHEPRRPVPEIFREDTWYMPR
jgi:ribosomal protein S18 acetylase RimI-like enzyme